ncbi:hypothetical protein M0638_10720 [Roseomonas sp. NAR14]|uniref:Uncharacterized protein n=1 Tax=Roseomonas acroporae TaxID=2937791 RepID=A0A9X1Y840_9PROT|nr:hypothetical protein [Roseomonas acroporae]MCK8784855.1 hypothetical protein [Roseomonas acroporae]
MVGILFMMSFGAAAWLSAGTVESAHFRAGRRRTQRPRVGKGAARAQDQCMT